MGTIKIQDSGFVKPTNSGTQASSANRANSGTVISLKTADFTPMLSRNLQINPEIGMNTPSEVNLGSLENMQFSLTCKLKTTDDTDMGNSCDNSVHISKGRSGIQLTDPGAAAYVRPGVRTIP